MKRLIKFKGKTNSGTWVYGHYGFDTPINAHFINDGKGCTFQVVPETVGQFTGLLDKNGKEIYEGDILGFTTERKMGYQEDGVEIALSVVFGRANPDNDSISEYMGFWAESSFGNRSSIGYQVECHGARVIGTIHDNPELLKGGKE